MPQTDTQIALRNCVVYGERLLGEIPAIVTKTIKRRDMFPNIDPERIAAGIVAHTAWASALEAAISEAKKVLDAVH